MNHATANVSQDAILAAITGEASEVSPAGNSAWQFTLLNGAPYRVTAKTDGDWLMFEADYASQAMGGDLLWGALEHNASLPGLAKIVLSPEGRLGLRAELPVLEGAALAMRVRETRRGFEAGRTTRGNGSPPAVPSPSETSSIDLKGLCIEAGWSYVERGDKSLAVELEAPGSFRQALLVPTEQGLRISCEVAAFDSINEESREAVAGLLLCASGLVRMGRASVNADETPATARFEIVFGSAPSPQEISKALDCLSVACSICGEEIITLQTPAIAQRYLEFRRQDADPAARQNERTAKR